MFFFYQIFISIIILLSPIIIFFRLIKGKEDKIRFLEKFCIRKSELKKGKTIWFHAASVGEIMSIIVLLRYYEKRKDIKNILVTTTTVSSAKIVKKLKFKKLIHQFYPIDYSLICKKFLDYWDPKIAIFLESEFWPAMFVQLKKKNIPLISLNTRITPKSFNRWIIIKSFAKKIFLLIKFAYPQNIETKNFLKKLNKKNFKEIGNLKYINDKNERSNFINKTIFKKFNKYKIWVAASTHDGEEYLAAKAHILLKKKYHNLLTIIIPRYIDNINKIKKKLSVLDLRIITHSSKQHNLKNIDIYIVDTFGESKNFYKIAPSVFLGKSIYNKGGQNPLEPAKYACNVLHGPNIENFKDVYKYLNKLKISKKVNSLDDLVSNIKFRKNYINSKKLKRLGANIYKQTIKELNTYLN